MGLYSIQAAAQISGISDACIRVWEKRYNCISPSRNSSNHRLYSEDDIERLKLLNKLTSIGMRIGQLSSLDTEELKKIYLSVNKEQANELDAKTTRAPASFFQSIYIIEESFNAGRFDVAHHELSKVIDSGHARDLALNFFPAIEGICQNWKDRKQIAPAQISAFEKYLTNLASQKAQKERQFMQGVKSVSISLSSNNNTIADAGLEMIMAAYKLDYQGFHDQPQTDFFIPLVKVINPKFVFIVSDKSSTETTKLIEALTEFSKSKIIIFDQKLSLLKTKMNSDSKSITYLNSILEIDRYLENSLQG